MKDGATGGAAHVLVDALGLTNLSGVHVLAWHLRGLAAMEPRPFRFTVLCNRVNRLRLEEGLGGVAEMVECPAPTARWLARRVWQRGRLPALLDRHAADLLLSTSGTMAPGCAVPQVALAMNPWALVPGVARGVAGRAKAALQRAAYRQAVAGCGGIAYLSGFMRDAYRRNAGGVERRGAVIYTGLDADLERFAQRSVAPPREEGRIVSVSAMAPHKGVETVLDAVAVLRERGLNATLDLVGAWPDRRYRRAMLARLSTRGLDGAVAVRDHLPREEMLGAMRRAKVFCLMSRCESFGIPAVEAQALGTPVVSSDCCAIPEVCGEGGLYAPAGDVEATADCLAVLLGHSRTWQEFSERAAANATRFSTGRCCGAFRDLLQGVAGG